METQIKTPIGTIFLEPEYAGKVFCSETEDAEMIPVRHEEMNLRYGYCFYLDAGSNYEDEHGRMIDFLMYCLKESTNNESKSVRSGYIMRATATAWLLTGKLDMIVESIKEFQSGDISYVDLLELADVPFEETRLQDFGDYVYEYLQTFTERDAIFTGEDEGSAGLHRIENHFISRSVHNVGPHLFLLLLDHRPVYKRTLERAEEEAAAGLKVLREHYHEIMTKYGAED